MEWSFCYIEFWLFSLGFLFHWSSFSVDPLYRSAGPYLRIFQLSDDEDESYEKSILNEKTRPTNDKKKSKKVSKGTDQDLCYYCRQAKQVGYRSYSFLTCFLL